MDYGLRDMKKFFWTALAGVFVAIAAYISLHIMAMLLAIAVFTIVASAIWYLVQKQKG